MDQEVLFILFILAAVCVVTAYVPHQYHFVNEKKTWDEAQRYCRENYTDLSTINNKDEMSKLNDILKDKPKNNVWIGLKSENVGEWQWSLADSQIKPKNIKWNPGEPNNYGGNEYCTMMRKSDQGRLHDVNCDRIFPSVCYDETKYPTERYVLINNYKNWYDALRYCRENHTDLVSVRNESENQQILNVIPSNINDVWTGLFKNTWKWSDGSDYCYTSWKGNVPLVPNNNENCVAMDMSDQNHYWRSDTCSNIHTFICHENHFILIKQNLTWTEALNYCRQDRMDLVSVHTEEIQRWVMEVSGKASTEHVWLGLRYTCVQHFWFWVSGSSVCYNNWAPGNGTGQEVCVYGDRTGAVQSRGEQQWVSLNENQRLNFICNRYEDEN